MKITKSPLEEILKQTTTTGSEGSLTLEQLEKAYEAAKDIPQPIDIEFKWKLAFRKQWPFVRLMKVGKWVYKESSL